MPTKAELAAKVVEQEKQIAFLNWKYKAADQMLGDSIAREEEERRYGEFQEKSKRRAIKIVERVGLSASEYQAHADEEEMKRIKAEEDRDWYQDQADCARAGIVAGGDHHRKIKDHSEKLILQCYDKASEQIKPGKHRKQYKRRMYESAAKRYYQMMDEDLHTDYEKPPRQEGKEIQHNRVFTRVFKKWEDAQTSD